VAEAKARLSEILEKVNSGQEVVLTKRAKPIARVIPMERTSRILGAGEHDANIQHACPGTRHVAEAPEMNAFCSTPTSLGQLPSHTASLQESATGSRRTSMQGMRRITGS
jgi:prevent-host-death family protein